MHPGQTLSIAFIRPRTSFGAGLDSGETDIIGAYFTIVPVSLRLNLFSLHRR